MKKLVSFALCLLLGAAFLLCGCDKQGELRHVTLNEVTRSVFYAPLYVAVSRGFFEAEGMEIEIVTGGGSDKSMTALLAGEADIALMGPETGVYVVSGGKDEHPMIVAQLTKRDGSFLVGREADDAFDWKSLQGKSIIGGRPGGTTHYVLRFISVA